MDRHWRVVSLLVQDVLGEGGFGMAYCQSWRRWAAGRQVWEIRWLAHAYPWLDEALQATVAGDDAGRALAEAQRKAEAYVLCLERKGDFTDPELLKACAREVDPDYPSFGE